MTRLVSQKVRCLFTSDEPDMGLNLEKNFPRQFLPVTLQRGPGRLPMKGSFLDPEM